MSNPDDTQPHDRRPRLLPVRRPRLRTSRCTRPRRLRRPRRPPLAARPRASDRRASPSADPPGGPPDRSDGGDPSPRGPAADGRAAASASRAVGSLSALAVACFLTLAAIFGYSIGANHGSNTTSASSNFPTQQIPYDPSTGQSSNGSSNGSSSSGQQANIDVQSIASKVSPSVVNLVSALNGVRRPAPASSSRRRVSCSPTTTSSRRRPTCRPSSTATATTTR